MAKDLTFHFDNGLIEKIPECDHSVDEIMDALSENAIIKCEAPSGVVTLIDLGKVNRIELSE